MHYFDRVRGLFRICFPYDEKPRRNWMEIVQVNKKCYLRMDEKPKRKKMELVQVYQNKIDAD